jgi:protein-S-isoprenylcysteine O-methyltransferase Ste14
MPTAVLEEMGIIGALLTLAVLVFLFTPTIQHPDPTLFWMMGASLFVNFGEMVFFSIGGMGFFSWYVMAFCHVAGLEMRESRKAMRTRTSAERG